MKPSAIVVALSLAGLVGCSGSSGGPVPFRTMPLTNIILFSDGSVYELNGELVANMDMTSSFEVKSADGKIVCSGTADARGQGANVCNNGKSYAFNIPKDKFGKFNGSYVDSKPEYRVAVGWGREADAEELKVMLGL